MKSLIIAAIGITLSICKADDAAAKHELVENASNDAATLRKLLKDNWVVTAKDNEITITSKFEVFIISLVSRGTQAPDFSEDTPRKVLLKEAKSEKYVIHLTYSERMSDEEYATKRKERQKLALQISEGFRTKDECTEVHEKFDQLKLPKYRSDSDILEETPDGQGCQVYPPSALQKVGGAKEILKSVLNQVLTDID